MPPKIDVIPKTGERALIGGMTGSGKTSLGLWILKRLSDPVIIYDTKIEPKFLALPKSREVQTPEELYEAYNNNADINEAGNEETLFDYFVIRPSADELLDPEAMDELWLNYHYNYLQGAPAYIDELSQWHNNMRPGRGLLNLLARGRSKGITLIMSTQRPRNISLSCLSEADRYFLMKLNLPDDRKRFGDVMRGIDPLYDTPKHFFHYYDHELDTSVFFNPVPLDDALNFGYTDASGANSMPTQDSAENLITII